MDARDIPTQQHLIDDFAAQPSPRKVEMCKLWGVDSGTFGGAFGDAAEDMGPGD